MIDLDRQEYIPLRQAAKVVPSGRKPGGCVHISTLVRWIKKGVRGKRLESCMIGGTRCTTRTALDRFLAELNDGAPTPALVPCRDPVRARRTDRILDREGLAARPRSDSTTAPTNAAKPHPSGLVAHTKRVVGEGGGGDAVDAAE